MKRMGVVGVMLLAAFAGGLVSEPDSEGFVSLFPSDGVPAGWHVTHWADVKDPPPEDAAWKVEQGVLHGGTPRGTWLVSDREYGDFILQLEFRLGERGNSGVGLRFPTAGDPAFDGLELQIVDPRYYGDQRVGPAELTGSLYPSIAPSSQLFKPTDWNRYEIECRGSLINVKLNDEPIQMVNLDEQTKPLERGEPLAKRPRHGHIGFQELSRGGGHVEIRGARIKELSASGSK